MCDHIWPFLLWGGPSFGRTRLHHLMNASCCDKRWQIGIKTMCNWLPWAWKILYSMMDNISKDTFAISHPSPSASNKCPCNRYRDYPLDQQFTYGVVGEGVIAEKFPQISAEFPPTPFPDAITCIVYTFPQTFCRIPANFPQKHLRKRPHKWQVTCYWRIGPAFFLPFSSCVVAL